MKRNTQKSRFDTRFGSYIDDEILGCIAILDARKNLAHLRWLILNEEARGLDSGAYLVDYTPIEQQRALPCP